MASNTSTNGFILAGGKSRRMGRDKAALPWGDATLLDHMTHLLSTVATDVRVVGRGAFLDRIPGKGPLGGILTALYSTNQDANIMLAVDLPLLTPHFLKQFHSRFIASSKQLVACRVDSRYPLCLGIRRSLYKDVARRVESGDFAVHSFIEESNPEILTEEDLRRLGVDPAIFANVNTPEDWDRFSP